MPYATATPERKLPAALHEPTVWKQVRSRCWSGSGGNGDGTSTAKLAHGIKNARIIGSPAHPWTDDEIRDRVISEHARAFNPPGVARQMAAVRGDGDRTAALAGLKIPVVVLHGADDPLLPKVGGEATAAAIPGAELRIVPGMGHDLPPGLHDTFVEAIAAAAARAKVGA